MVRTELVIGIIGGIIGLLMTPLNLILGIVIAALTLGTFAQLLILTGIGAIMAVTGMVGAVVSGGHPRTGGLMMLLSGLVPLLVGTAMMASVNALGALVPLYALYFWTFILILSGLIAIFRGSKKPPQSPPLASGAGSPSPL